MGDLNPVSGKDAAGHLFPSIVVHHACKAQKIERADGICRGLRAVIVLFQPDGDERITRRAAEVASARLVPEKLVLNRLELGGTGDPTLLERGLVEINESWIKKA